VVPAPNKALSSWLSFLDAYFIMLNALVGTGKTTTARKFGQVYYDLGFLSQVEVVECSATDLIGQYVGHTGPKTTKQLERGLGKVLFIDEAYRLGEGRFAQEAVNELVDLVTKPKFAGKMVIILAGYDKDMNNLLKVNEGLSSRFADEIIFKALSPKHCLRILEEKLKQSRIAFPELQDSSIEQEVTRLISKLSSLSSWGNARDVLTLAKDMVRAVYQSNPPKSDQLIISKDLVMASIQSMLSDRLSRNNLVPALAPSFDDQIQSANSFQEPPAPSFSNSVRTRSITSQMGNKDEQAQNPAAQVQESDESRDSGVTDAIWTQLQQDKKAAELESQRLEKALRDKEEECRIAEEEEKEAIAEAAEALVQALRAKDEAEAQELGRKREQARIRELEAKTEKERIVRELQKRQEEEMERKRKEQQAQTKLRQMGVCPVGFRWIKQSGGYRCAGGAHWVTDAQLSL